MVFSRGFKSFVDQEMNENEVKVYCSEMVILAIIKLIKKNDLTAEEVSFINDDCLRTILEYTFVKYPQSLETEKNKELSDIVTETDNISDPRYDQVHRSGVKF